MVLTDALDGSRWRRRRFWPVVVFVEAYLLLSIVAFAWDGYWAGVALGVAQAAVFTPLAWLWYWWSFATLTVVDGVLTVTAPPREHRPVPVRQYPPGRHTRRRGLLLDVALARDRVQDQPP